jgi:hypothetical protein
LLIHKKYFFELLKINLYFYLYNKLIMTKKELWLQIKNYHFNNIVPPSLWNIVVEKFGGVDASTKAFANKIAEKHGWSYMQSLAAVREYKKFVYLGVVSNFIVTPSLLVDVIWHEHLLFSKAYRDFCEQIIQYQFDHYPELLPMELNTKKYEAQYKRTIQLYIQEFGIAPPENIWGIAKFKLEDKKNWQTQTVADCTSDYADEIHLHFYFENEKLNYSIEYMEFTIDTTANNGDVDGNWDDTDDGDSGVSGDSDGGCSSGCGGD